MKLDEVLGFPLEPVRIDPDGCSTPPEVANIAPPSNPVLARSPRQHLLEPTRIEGLAAPIPQLPPVATPIGPRPLAPGPLTPQPVFAPEPYAAPGPSWDPDALDEELEPAPSPVDTAAPESASGAASSSDAARAQLDPHWLAQLEYALAPLLASARGRATLIVLACASTSLLGFGAALLWTRAAPPPEPAAAPALRAPEPASKQPAWSHDGLSHAPCTRQREPRRVAQNVSPSVPLEALAIPGGVEVLIGGAAASGEALGLELNATTLEAKELLREPGSRQLLGVVPVLGERLQRFTVDRAGIGGYRDRRTLVGRRGLALSRTNRGLHLMTRERPALPLWPLDSDDEVSRPRVAFQDADRLAVALRRGGRQGRLMVGFFDLRSEQRSALRELPLGAGEVGLPSVALQHDRAAIVAAVRASRDEPWHIELATSEWYGQTRRAALPELVANARTDAIAPSVAALNDGRWLLQWTEGEQGRRQLRALTLDTELAPIGEPLVISEPGGNAGAGLLAPVDEGLMSLYLREHGSLYELWAAPLACR